MGDAHKSNRVQLSKKKWAVWNAFQGPDSNVAEVDTASSSTKIDEKRRRLVLKCTIWLVRLYFLKGTCKVACTNLWSDANLGELNPV